MFKQFSSSFVIFTHFKVIIQVDGEGAQLPFYGDLWDIIYIKAGAM